MSLNQFELNALTAKIVRSKKIQILKWGTVRKAVLALISPLFFLGVQAFAQGQDFSKVEIKVQKGCRHGVHATGAAETSALRWARMGSSSWTTSFFPLADKIEAALKGITDKPVKFILNTHWHGDHTGGNPHFGAKAPIIAQETFANAWLPAARPALVKSSPRAKSRCRHHLEEDVTVHLNARTFAPSTFPTAIPTATA